MAAKRGIVSYPRFSCNYEIFDLILQFQDVSKHINTLIRFWCLIYTSDWQKKIFLPDNKALHLFRTLCEIFESERYWNNYSTIVRVSPYFPFGRNHIHTLYLNFQGSIFEYKQYYIFGRWIPGGSVTNMVQNYVEMKKTSNIKAIL